MILIVDDDKNVRMSLGLQLRHSGYDVCAVATPDDALDELRRTTPQLIFMDMNFSGSTTGNDGLELLQKVKILVPDTPVILITAWGSIPLAVEGMRLGAFDFLTKPWNSHMLLQRVHTAIALHTGDADDSDAGSFDRCGIVGRSPALEAVLDTVRRVAPTDVSVLITGENGTGKEMIAQALHANSRRRSRPFVKVNLGGVPQSLFESEMFGHAKGAFTGAVAARKGRFEIADRGSIFLDEIGDLDLTCQVKLLRVLQEGTFEPLGDSRQRRVDVRTICATNADLPAMLRARTFREDLFYRINSITLHLPALRERRTDIPLLANHFAANMAQHGSKPARFAADAMEYLTRLPYPGNIRQLKNIVERAILVSGHDTIERADIESADRLGLQPAATSAAAHADLNLDEIERTAIEQAIARHGGNLSLAAIELGITRQSLYRRMEKFGLK